MAFFTITHDGFALNAQRRPIAANDLPQVLADCTAWMQGLAAGNPINTVPCVTAQTVSPAAAPTVRPEPVEGLDVKRQGLRQAQSERIGAVTTPLHLVDKTKLSASGDYNLSGERYREVAHHAAAYDFVLLGDVCEVKKGSPITRETLIEGNIPVIAGGQKPAYFHGESNREGETITVSASGAYAGFVNFFRSPIFASDCTTIKSKSDDLQNVFLYYLLKNRQQKIYALQMGMGQPHVYPKDLAKFQIPLPPLAIQQAIVAEIERHQTIIDGARAVVDNYQPQIDIDPSWDSVNLGSITTIVRGSSPRPQGDPKYFGGNIPRLMISDITRDGMYTTPTTDSLTELGATKSRPMTKGEVIITVSGNPGLPTILAVDACIHDGFVGFRELSNNVMPEYLYFCLLAQHAMHGSHSSGAVFRNLTTDQIKEFDIPLPPLATQQAIVAQIQAEQALVNANRELITRFEAKIATTLARVWGDAAQ